jgi:hypothetical protein
VVVAAERLGARWLGRERVNILVPLGSEGGKGKYFCPDRCSVVTQREGGRKKTSKIPQAVSFPYKTGCPCREQNISL